MDHRAALLVLLRQRLETLLEAMPAAQAGDVRSVHQARVATRRLREALPVLRKSLDAHAIDRARQRVRRMTRALGPVRELDVALLHLDEFANRGVATGRAIDRVRQAITRRTPRAPARDARRHHAGQSRAAPPRAAARRLGSAGRRPAGARFATPSASVERARPRLRRRDRATPAASIWPTGCTPCASPPRSCATRWRSSAS